MFSWLGKLIKNKLHITSLENELCAVKKSLSNAEKEIMDLKSDNKIINQELDSLRQKYLKSTSQYNSLMELVDLGIDVNRFSERGPTSWAVVCLAGKIEYMKFYVLGHNEMAEIHKFLKPYDEANRVVDAASHVKRFLL